MNRKAQQEMVGLNSQAKRKLARQDESQDRRNKLAQQEMVGFVLIVIIVVVGLMIFLLFSLRSSGEKNSVEVENMLSSILKMTTDCATVFEPEYDNYEDLFKSCYENKRCANLGEDSCDYLNSSLRKVFEELVKGESTIGAFQLDFFTNEGANILRVVNGNCSNSLTSSSQRSIKTNSVNLVIRLKVCKED
jgi:hypothetical protein